MLSTTQLIILSIIIWFTLGLTADILKNSVRALGKSIEYIPKSLHDSSSSIKETTNIKQDIDTKIVKDFVKGLNTGFSNFGRLMTDWADNFLEQVVGKLQFDLKDDEGAGSKGFLIFKNPRAGQLIIGALLELIALLAFLYADASLSAQTVNLLLYPKDDIPDFLRKILIPTVISSAGSAFMLGVFLGDLLGITELGVFGNIGGKKKTLFTFLVTLNLISIIVLATFISLYRVDYLEEPITASEKIEMAKHDKLTRILSEFNISENIELRQEELPRPEISTIHKLSNYALGLILVPLLVTTALLFRGVFGIFVLLSLLLRMLAIPFGLFGYLFKLFDKLIDAGAVSGEFIFRKLIWLTSASIELVFDLLEVAVQGSFKVLLGCISIVLAIPYILIQLLLGIATRFFNSGKSINILDDIISDIELSPPSSRG